MDEDKALEIESEITRDEQSAAWRDVAREALRLGERIVWLAWAYGMIRLAVEVGLRLIP